MKDQKLGHLPARDLSDIRLQIGFQRAARAQDRHPLRDVHMAANLLSARKQDVIFDVEDPRGGVGAFEVFAKLQKIPALAMDHRRVGGSLKGVQLVDQPAIEVDRDYLGSLRAPCPSRR